MQIKIRYDNSFQTVEVTEAECESMIRNDYEERCAASADPSTVQPRTMQEIMDERFNRPEYNNYQTAHRHHYSIDATDYEGEAYMDPDADIVADLEKGVLHLALHAALDELLPQQIELIRRIYFNGERALDVAADMGISKQALNSRLNRIYSLLQKKLKEF